MYKFLSLIIILPLAVGVSMSHTMVYPKINEISGDWFIMHKLNICDVHIGKEFIESANGYNFLANENCTFLSNGIQAWRPTPDGIVFVDLSGSAVLFMERRGDYYASVMDEGVIYMKRR